MDAQSVPVPELEPLKFCQHLKQARCHSVLPDQAETIITIQVPGFQTTFDVVLQGIEENLIMCFTCVNEQSAK
jgi:hypothetical protein